MSDEQREMTLKEWCAQLPDSHRVNEEQRTICKTIALLNSMVLCGEQHSAQSEKAVKEAIDFL